MRVSLRVSCLLIVGLRIRVCKSKHYAHSFWITFSELGFSANKYLLQHALSLLNESKFAGNGIISGES